MSNGVAAPGARPRSRESIQVFLLTVSDAGRGDGSKFPLCRNIGPIEHPVLDGGDQSECDREQMQLLLSVGRSIEAVEFLGKCLLAV
mmetsp:Transcript_67212/g.179525  ORF Transcript_67212/g.179525 Transcript_67212/m.179525 type:complete len:87 (-) Transcript_67212:127-387(-)